MAKNVNRGRGQAKADLPEKTCVVCGRAFTWRKKWERDWEHVKYCSKRCASARKDRDGTPN